MAKINLTKNNKVKEYAKSCDISAVSSEFYDVLDTKIQELVKVAVTRAKSNGRNTLMSRDL